MPVTLRSIHDSGASGPAAHEEL